jgi:hypothetical protein
VELLGEEGEGVSRESEWMAIRRFRDCEPIRTATIAKGSEAKPRRRATSGDWSTYEC